MGILYEDTLQRAGKHEAKHEWWAAHGVEVVRTRFDGRHGVPVDFGDYYRDGSNVVVDTKAHVDELCKNLCSKGAEHVRVRNEVIRAAEAGYRLVFLVENVHGYGRMSDLLRWEPDVCSKCRRRAKAGKPGGCVPADRSEKGGYYHGPHCKVRSDRYGRRVRKPVMGAQLYETCKTMRNRYGCRFEFCAPEDSARRVCELLGMEYGKGGEVTR